MSPFDPWMATYPQGAVEGRPWWHPCDGGFRRCDGRDVKVYAFVAEAEVSPGVISGAVRVRSAEEMLAEMARIDTTHPLPVPPPMPTQVWAVHRTLAPGVVRWWEWLITGRDGTNGVVENVKGLYAYGDGDLAELEWSSDGESVTGARDLGQWPRPRAVLVSGPHAPWAPAGWKP